MSDTTYLVMLGDREFRVRIRRRDEQLFVRVNDGEEIRASLDHVRGVLYALSLGSERHELLGLASGNEVQLVVDGLQQRAEVVDEARARLASLAGSHTATHARRELRAPMPGLLVSVLAQQGDTVSPNQPLAVLRAMKMENELSLPWGGTITRVAAAEGDTIDQNQLILILD